MNKKLGKLESLGSQLKLLDDKIDTIDQKQDVRSLLTDRMGFDSAEDDNIDH